LIRHALGAIAVLGLGLAAAEAGEADVLAAKVHKFGPGVYRFDVTVRHADTGWQHYVDRWQVIGADGAVLGERVLLHPHVGEQPFTRSARIKVAAGVARVRVRAHDSVHSFGGREVEVDLPQ